MKICLLLFTCLLLQFAFGKSGFVLLKNKKLNIPFVFAHNLVIIPVEINGFMMNILLDTGVKETMVFGKSLGDVDEMKIERNGIKSNFRFILEDPLSFEHQNR